MLEELRRLHKQAMEIVSSQDEYLMLMFMAAADLEAQRHADRERK
jgi:hypothetical protein